MAPASPCTGLRVAEHEVRKAIQSFPAGSSGGSDGIRPQHILDLVHVQCKEASTSLLSTITDFVNMFLAENCPSEVASVIFGGRLIALRKKSSGIRPIAIGYFWRRLASKVANKYAIEALAEHFTPIQVGVGVKSGCEAAVHAAHRFLLSLDGDGLLFETDFNTLRRDCLLDTLLREIPELYPLCHSAYLGISLLCFGPHIIESAEGVQQGDPLGPLLFCLTLQPILQMFSSRFRVGFLDDVCFRGSSLTAKNDLDVLITECNKIGLTLNVGK